MVVAGSVVALVGDIGSGSEVVRICGSAKGLWRRYITAGVRVVALVAGMGKQDGGVVENGVPAAWAGMVAKSWVGDGVLQRAGGQAAGGGCSDKYKTTSCERGGLSHRGRAKCDYASS